MIKKTLLGLLVLLILAASLVLWLYKDLKAELRAPLNISQTEILNITPGMSLSAIAYTLQDKNWIEHAEYLILYGRRRNIAGAIKTGEYQLAPGTTAIELLDIIVTGKVAQHSLALIEGWTFSEIIKAIRHDPNIHQTLESYEPDSIMSAIGKAGYFAEGRFYPDTYLFPAGMSDVAFLSRAFDELERVLAEEWQNRAAGLPYASPYEALIMASIIEKETAVAEERAIIAGVFVRRLHKGMKLQTDPTVIYALDIHFDGNIRKKDLKYDSPYNTYVYPGLPPTPIAAAGRAAIHAALHPEPGQALYFVAKGDGRHQFSATLAEHNAAVRKYQLKKP